MNRSEIETRITQATGNRKDARIAMDAIIEAISDALAAGDRVYIKDLAVLKAHVTPERMVRNPATGQKVPSPARARIKVEPSAPLAQRILANQDNHKA